MEKEEYLSLQHSESVVAQMAATIVSSLIARDTSYASNEDELIEKSVLQMRRLREDGWKIG